MKENKKKKTNAKNKPARAVESIYGAVHHKVVTGADVLFKEKFKKNCYAS